MFGFVIFAVPWCLEWLGGRLQIKDSLETGGFLHSFFLPSPSKGKSLRMPVLPPFRAFI